MAASALTALGSVALKAIIDSLSTATRAHVAPAAVMVALYVLSQWLSRSVGEIRGLVYARAERRMARTLSERVLAQLIWLPLRFHLDRQTGAVTQALTNGLQAIR
jgi:ATP-binding cassette subfamily B protein